MTSSSSSRLALAAAALGIASAPAWGAPFEAEGAVASSIEYDSNANRAASGDIGGGSSSTDEERPAADALSRTTLALTLRLREPGLVVSSESAAGLKLFVKEDQQRMAVAQTRVDVMSARLPAELVATLSALAKVRAQLSGERTYALLRTDALVERPVWQGDSLGMSLRGGVSAIGFHAFDAPSFSSGGASIVVGGRLSLSSAERFDLLVDVGGRGFPFSLTGNGTRLDGNTTAAMSFVSARRLFLSVGYVLQRNASSARAESYLRHRVSALLGFRLPGEVTCALQGAVQLTQYDNGVSFGQQYFLGDDEDNQNVVELNLRRPLFGGVSIDGRVTFMGNELADEGARFSRETVALGLRAEL